MTSKEIRQQFLDFFKSKGHRIVPSSPVVPFDDPTLLFTNAGMNQFKDVFLGTGKRDYKRAVNTQKCIRVSGKHNDLEEVGHDTYHHTFFEMLGNWSFGDYYKPEVIEWAWELLTEVWKLPKERLWVTVFRTDDEAFEFWKTKTDINPKHILRFDEKDNFWEMGETGPCGPCSEIHINLGNDFENPKYVNAGLPECIEIWNLVFIQYNRDENGILTELPAKHVDTGMGFERVCAILQKKNSNYDTDIFTPLIDEISKLSNIKYDKDLSRQGREEDKIPMRVIADHARALTFAIADGAVPGNEGRGYVLRRILRRAARYGRKLNLHKPFIYKLVDILVKTMGDVFPEIKDKQEFVEKVIKAEEENFNATLDRGIELFGEVVSLKIRQLLEDKYKPHFNVGWAKIFLESVPDYLISIKKNPSHKTIQLTVPIDKFKLSQWSKELRDKLLGHEPKISGKDIFKLYDTYGFPIDLINIMAREMWFIIDEEGFDKLMEEQKQRGREARKEITMTSTILSSVSLEIVPKINTEFTGYDELKSEAKIIWHEKENGNELIVLDKTPFYVEAGGQIDDLGYIILETIPLNVIDVTKIDNKTVHIIENTKKKSVSTGKKVLAQVDERRRWDIMRNHTATHFFHSALRKILGTHVHQAGSYVGPDRLRFDFTHFSKVEESELKEIETLVNEELRQNYELQHHRNIPFDEAKKMGALMFFGDKYGDKVNVVQFGEFTKEFCGGTHIYNSSQIGLFKIISESSISSGVRRIEAVTGSGVERFIQSQFEQMKSSEEKIAELLEDKKKLEKELSELKFEEKKGQISSVLNNPSEINGIKIYKAQVTAENNDELKSLGDELRSKTKSSVGVLFSVIDGKVGIVCVVTDDLIKEKNLSAGKIVGELAKLVGGGGGGRPHLATAGGKEITKIQFALNKTEEIIKSFLNH
ncbi:MAG: alanine--tRNA ligase [Ignavibacteria bacterium RBG_16_34_14]|nr:MAG: alanine--tRNA ligase [Ignavibacteria bacterium RBG_16_34_14]